MLGLILRKKCGRSNKARPRGGYSKFLFLREKNNLAVNEQHSWRSHAMKSRPGIKLWIFFGLAFFTVVYYVYVRPDWLHSSKISACYFNKCIITISLLLSSLIEREISRFCRVEKREEWPKNWTAFLPTATSITATLPEMLVLRTISSCGFPNTHPSTLTSWLSPVDT